MEAAFLKWPVGMAAPGRKARIPKLSGQKQQAPSEEADEEVAFTSRDYATEYLSQEVRLLDWLSSPEARHCHDSEVLTYLSNGPPFKGSVPWPKDETEEAISTRDTYKEHVRDAGGRWLVNSDPFTKRRGWWVANDLQALRQLVELGTDIWKPESEHAHDAVALVDAFRTECAERDEAERLEKLSAREEARRNSAGMRDELGIVESSTDDLELLRTRWALDPTPELLQAVEGLIVLGPRSGCSAAQRLLRGLKHGLVSPEQCMTLDVSQLDVSPVTPPTSATSFTEWLNKQTKGASENASVVESVGDDNAYAQPKVQLRPVAESASSVLMFGTSYGARPMSSDAEFWTMLHSWQREEHARVGGCRSYAPRVQPAKQCTKCKGSLDDQFGDCRVCEQRLAFA
jgi:hypothetical protein